MQISAFIRALKKQKGIENGKRKLHAKSDSSSVSNNNPINACDLEQNRSKKQGVAIAVGKISG